MRSILIDIWRGLSYLFES